MPDITYACPAGPLPAYMAVPLEEGGPWPGVVVLHDAAGLTNDIRRIVDRLAAAGYLAIAPALYHRGARLRCVVSTIKAASRGRGAAFDDILAARDRLLADPGCTGRVASIGFCLGGSFCLQLAPGSAFDATAPNYGMWPKDRTSLRESCPMVASYGRGDRFVSGAAATLESILTDGGVPHDVKEYPAAGHSFMNDWGTPRALQFVERIAGLAYSAPEAEDAWERILAFFWIHLH